MIFAHLFPEKYPRHASRHDHRHAAHLFSSWSWFSKASRLGLISLVPNFIPAAMTFGLWGYLVGRVGLAGSVMTTIAFGIIVDDTIHFMSRYLKARRMGLSAPKAVRATFRIVGQALWTTTAVLTLRFLVFASSGFEPSRALGLMVSITLVFALLADFLLLPTLLMAIDRKELSHLTPGAKGSRLRVNSAGEIWANGETGKPIRDRLKCILR